MVACHQSQCRQNFNAPLLRLVNTAAMALRYLPEVQQHLAPPFPVWKHMRRNPYRKKKRLKKSIFIYGTTFLRNKPIGASPGHDYVLTRMVLQIIQYDTLHSVLNDISKKGGMLRGLWIKIKRGVLLM